MRKKHILRVAALSMALTLFTSSGYALTLRYPQQGDDVAELQSALKQLGYYKETINGEYGTGTLNAVRAFQKTYGLKSDGVAGPKTLEKLEALTGIKIDGESSYGDPENEVTQAPIEKPTSTPSPMPGATPSGTLRYGDTGEDVKLLQNRLIELGYLTGKVDGTFDSATLTAVKAFQKNNSLTADGVAGSWTCKKLFSASAVGADPTSADVVPADGSALRHP